MNPRRLRFLSVAVIGFATVLLIWSLATGNYFTAAINVGIIAVNVALFRVNGRML